MFAIFKNIIQIRFFHYSAWVPTIKFCRSTRPWVRRWRPMRQRWRSSASRMARCCSCRHETTNRLAKRLRRHRPHRRQRLSNKQLRRQQRRSLRNLNRMFVFFIKYSVNCCYISHTFERFHILISISETKIQKWRTKVQSWRKCNLYQLSNSYCERYLFRNDQMCEWYGWKMFLCFICRCIYCMALFA